jgi:catechol 2,3-dioxygenase-like lactoylglutathione lyase family enzyme
LTAPTPPLCIIGLDHVVLRCADLDRTRDFYTRVLGCSLERVVESIGLHQLRAGAALIDLVPADRDGPGARAGEPADEGRNMDHFCLRVARGDWAILLEHLRAHGVTVSEPARRYGAEGQGESVYLEDPEGNIVELKAPPR